MSKENKDSLRPKIIQLFGEIYKAQNNTDDVPPLSDETVLLQSGIDSLGFAILVTRLEEELGYDPFSVATEAYYPRTFGEFLAFYRKHAPQ